MDKQFPVPSRDVAKRRRHSERFVGRRVHTTPDAVTDTFGKQETPRMHLRHLSSRLMRARAIPFAGSEAGTLLVFVEEKTYRGTTGEVQRFRRNSRFVGTAGCSPPAVLSPLIQPFGAKTAYILGYDENGQVTLGKFRIELPNERPPRSRDRPTRDHFCSDQKA